MIDEIKIPREKFDYYDLQLKGDWDTQWKLKELKKAQKELKKLIKEIDKIPKTQKV